jgi:transposase
LAAQVIRNVKKDTPRNVVLRRVEAGSTLSADELVSYGLLNGDGHKHGVVSHAERRTQDHRTDAFHHTNDVVSL